MKLQAQNFPDPHKDTKVRSLVIFYTLLLSKSSLLRRPLPAAVRWALATPIINLESPVARAVVVATAYRDTQENVVGFFCPSHLSRAVCLFRKALHARHLFNPPRREMWQADKNSHAVVSSSSSQRIYAFTPLILVFRKQSTHIVSVAVAQL